MSYVKALNRGIIVTILKTSSLQMKQGRQTVSQFAGMGLSCLEKSVTMAMFLTLINVMHFVQDLFQDGNVLEEALQQHLPAQKFVETA